MRRILKGTGTAFVLLFCVNTLLTGQIDNIKNNANENKNEHNNDDNNNENNSEGIGEDILTGCFEVCFDAGCQMVIGVIAEYTEELYQTKDVDPSILSVDLNANFSLGYHYVPKGSSITHVNYLPGIRLNLVSFILDFKYNVLTEYTDGFPDLFKTWHLDLAFNIAPDETFKLGLGMGVEREQFTNMYFHEYFLTSKIGLNDNVDYVNLDLRTSVDYETSAVPYFETGLFYNKRMIDFEGLSAYISLGGFYQNYYSSYDVWSIRGGVIFNWH